MHRHSDRGMSRQDRWTQEMAVGPAGHMESSVACWTVVETHRPLGQTEFHIQLDTWTCVCPSMCPPVSPPMCPSVLIPAPQPGEVRGFRTGCAVQLDTQTGLCMVGHSAGNGWTDGGMDGRTDTGMVEQADTDRDMCSWTQGWLHSQTDRGTAYQHSQHVQSNRQLYVQPDTRTLYMWLDRHLSSQTLFFSTHAHKCPKNALFCPQGPSAKPTISHPHPASTLFPTVHGFGVGIGPHPSPTPRAWAGRWTGINPDRLTPGVGAGQRDLK